jgi:hypothetical protein
LKQVKAKASVIAGHQLDSRTQHKEADRPANKAIGLQPHLVLENQAAM